MRNEEPPPKRRRLDAIGRLAVAKNTGQCQPSSEASSSSKHARDSSLTGRGSVDGWTSCPLCGKYSKKKYAVGKGIASHLVAIHTPWNPTKLSLKIERRKKEEQQRQVRQTQQQQEQKGGQAEESANTDKGSTEKAPSNMKSPTSHPTKAWKPTSAEREAWDAKVLAILSQLEQQQTSNDPDRQSQKMMTRSGSH